MSSASPPSTAPTPAGTTSPIPADWEVRQQLFKDTHAEMLAMRQTGFDQLNNIVTTLSGVLFGISVSFVKDIVPLARTVALPLLWLSWIGFIAAVLSFLCSHATSVRSADDRITYAHEYYLEYKNDSLRKKSKWATATDALNILGLFCFVSALALTAWFASVNVTREAQYQRDAVRKKDDEEAMNRKSRPKPPHKPQFSIPSKEDTP